VIQFFGDWRARAKARAEAEEHPPENPAQVVVKPPPKPAH
jgi:hypothetical protein